MREQRIIWTALPNGRTAAVLNLSVFVAPRLSTDETPPTLSLFPDFVNWPAAVLTWTVSINGTSAGPVTVTSPARNPALWQKLFAPSTPVATFIYRDLTGHTLHSYPAGYVRDFHASTYATYAAATPTEWPTFASLFRQGPAGPAPYGNLPFNDQLEQAAVRQIAAMLSENPFHAIPPSGTPNPTTDLVQAKLFLQPLYTLPPGATNSSIPPPVPPAIDFHRMVSLLGQYPVLLRLFGLVFDLQVPVPSGLPTTVSLKVLPTWTPLMTHPPVAGRTSIDLEPDIQVATAAWSAAPQTSNPELSGGVLRLSDPGGYRMIELETDGSALKTLDFAKSVFRATQQAASADTPQAYALPALRSGGLALARTGQALAFGHALAISKGLDGPAETTPPGPVTLHAEDVTRGFRIDVLDDRTNRWHQLCARIATPVPPVTSPPLPPAPGGYAIGSPATVVPVPPGDEGWVELSVASGPAGGSNDLYLSETVLKWSGWSLIAPRPGKHLTKDPADGLEQDQNNPPTGAFPLQVAYSATPGTLPTLRYGRTYRFQARAVDLAGNSNRFDPTPTAFSLQWASPPLRYGRLEPVPTPAVIPYVPRTAGEHLERIVIRSDFYNTPDANVSASQRHIVPPVTTEEIAEAHGALDLPSGAPDASAYGNLAARAGITYADAAVIKALGGKPDPAGHNQPYFHTNDLFVVYLPDVVARGAALLGLPGTLPTSPPLLMRFADPARPWPAAKAFRLVVAAGTGAPQRSFGSSGNSLRVLAPKASITTVRLSSYLAPGDLPQMGLWEWLEEQGAATASLATLIENGQHWMFTPYRELVIVHAVRQPLTSPQFTVPTIARDYGKTFALLSDTVKVDRQSSVKLDILSTWTEPFDDSVNPLGYVLVNGQARVGEVSLKLGDPTPTTAPVNALRHDFGDTKHRNVRYEARATTRFLEYFERNLVVTLTGTTKVVIHAGGLATGATIVSATGGTNAVYRAVIDYIEDDVSGTIQRVPSGAIADGESVNVRFVPHPVTRSSFEVPTPPNTSTGYPLSVPSTARPAAPDLRYILPAFSFTDVATSATITSTRRGGVLRVYLGRPWWSSGEGELLGVVVYQPPVGVAGFPPGLEPFVTRYGRDPIWVAESVRAQPSTDDFTLVRATGTNLLLQEAVNLPGPPLVKVAGHTVGFDATHHLYYSDIQIDTAALNPTGAPGRIAASYWPFVRLALVRYQPASLSGVESSRVVQADVIQLASDRTAVLTFPTSTTVQIQVSGPGYVTSNFIQGTSTMIAYSEVLQPGVTDPDLQWISSGAPGVTLTSSVGPYDIVTWTGTLTLPVAAGSQPMRVRLEESEIYGAEVQGVVLLTTPRVTYINTLGVPG